MNKILSVILPTYNRRDKLEKSLSTYLEEDIQCIEFIILDNDSTDSTEEFVFSVKQKDSRIKYFKNPQNLGYNRNLYRGFLEASADWIIVLADDDIMEVGYFSELLKVIEGNSDCAIIMNALKNQMPDGEYKLTNLFEKTTRIAKGLAGIKALYMWTGSVPGFTFNRKLINQTDWLLDDYIYPQIRIAISAAINNDTVYFVPSKCILIPSSDSAMVRAKDAMGRPLDYGVYERINILIDVTEKLSAEDKNKALNELSMSLFSWSLSIFNLMYKEDKKYSFKYFDSLLKHKFIQSSLLFWLMVFRNCKNNKTSANEKIYFIYKFFMSLLLSLPNKNLYRSGCFITKKIIKK